MLLPVVPLFLVGWFLYPHFPFIAHGLVGDGYAHAMYGTIFLYGFLIGRNAGLWAEIARLRRWTLALGPVVEPLLRHYGKLLDPAEINDVSLVAGDQQVGPPGHRRESARS